MVLGHRSSTDVLSSSKAGGEFLLRGKSRRRWPRHFLTEGNTRSASVSLLRVSRPPSAPGPTRAEHQSTGRTTNFDVGARPVSGFADRSSSGLAASPPSRAGRSFPAIALSASTPAARHRTIGPRRRDGSPTKRGLSDSVRARPGRRCRSARASSGRRRRSATSSPSEFGLASAIACSTSSWKTT